MKRLNIILLAALLLIGVVRLQAQNAVTMQACEYWFDYDFDARERVNMNGSETFERTFDLAHFAPGLHSIGLQFCDSKGLWMAPIVKHFVIPSTAAPMHPDNHITQLEYWIDYDFEHRTVVPTTDGNVALTFDASALAPGLHSFAYYARDSRGLYLAPIVKHFIIPSQAAPMHPDNAIRNLRWWIDYDEAHATTQPMADGVAELELDLSALPRGLHSLAYQVSDERGLWMAPIVKHFVIPSLPFGHPWEIASYDYWINDGAPTHVAVSPITSELQSELTISLDDITPTNIADDYRFDPSLEMAYTSDHITFSFQPYALDGKPAMELQRQEGDVELKVNPQVVALADDEPTTFAAPGAGSIRGFKATAMPGDSLVWTFRGHAQIDFYSTDGTHPAFQQRSVDAATTEYIMTAATEQTYALVLHATDTAAMTIRCRRAEPSPIVREYIDEQGVRYAITNEADTAYAVVGYTDALVPDVVVPNELFGLPVREMRQSAFAGSRLRSIEVGSQVVTAGGGLFRGATELLSVDWNTQAALSADCFDSPADCGNLLVYVPTDGVTAFRGNVVVGGAIVQLTLHDQQPLRVVREFLAGSISYVRHFTKQTYFGAASGWEGLVLPFDVQHIGFSSRQLAPFGSSRLSGNEVTPFWLASMHNGQFTAATMIEANRPYILAMPNNPNYGSYNVEGDVAFTAEQVTVHSTLGLVPQGIVEELTLLPCYEGKAQTVAALCINDELYTSAAGDVYVPGGVFVRNSRDVRPFETYLVTQGSVYNAKAFIPIFNQDDTAVRAVDADGRTDDEAVYDLSGRCVATDYADFLRRQSSLRPGVYLIGRQKVYVR